MTVGVIAPALLGGVRAGTVTAASPPTGSRSGYLPAAPRSGSLTAAPALTIRSRTVSGFKAGSFLYDFYNRVHIVPQAIDFGSIAVESARTASIWNAYLAPVTLSSITSPADDNVTVSGITPPVVIPSLAIRSLTFTAAVDGPPTIDTAFTLTFSTGDNPRITLSGQRARLWPFPPNWRDAVTVTTSYKTDIAVARSSREQRRSLRTYPRRTFSIPTTVHANQMRQFMQAMQKWQNQPVLIADPLRAVFLGTGVPADTDTVTLDGAVPDWLVAGANVVFETPERSEVRNVVSVTGSAVVFTKDTPYAWPPSTRLRPTLGGLFGAEVSTANPTNRVIEATINFDVDPGSEPQPDRTPAVWIHNGREVFVKRPNWGDTVNTRFRWPVEQVDFGHGRLATYRPVDFSTMLRQATYVGQTADEANEIERFFDRQFGRRGEFYMPTGLEDMFIRGAVVAGTTTLRVQGTEIYDTFNGDAVYRALVVRFTDGRMAFRSVTGMFVVGDGQGDDTVLELDTEWLAGFSAEDVAGLSWMPVFRFGSDDMTTEWLTDEVAQTQLTMQTLEDLTAEGDLPEYDGAAQWVLEVWGANGLQWLPDMHSLVCVMYPEIDPRISQFDVRWLPELHSLVCVMYPEIAPA